MILLKSSLLAAETPASCSSSRRKPARITSDLLLKRPLATNRSINFSKCGVMTLLMLLVYSNCLKQLSRYPHSRNSVRQPGAAPVMVFLFREQNGAIEAGHGILLE